MSYRHLLCLIILILVAAGSTALASESSPTSLGTVAEATVNPSGLSYAPNAVLLGQDEIVYLLSQENLSVFRWSIPQRSYTDTVSLTQSPNYLAYSGETNRLYLGYSPNRITQVKIDESLTEQPFVNSPETLCGLSTAGEYVFACDSAGAWYSHITYRADGTQAHQQEWCHYSEEYIWSAANRRMYFFQDWLSPNDLNWEVIDTNGVIGSDQDSPYHSSSGIQHPIRVAPDGSVVVLGSGRIYDAISLVLIHTLPNTVADAAWAGGNLFTLRDYGNGTELQKWDSSYNLVATQQVDGKPIAIFGVSEGLLVITDYFNKPWFSIWNTSLEEVYQLSIYQVFLPAVFRNYCPDFFDDFSNPASGWSVGEDSYVRSEYLSGEYRILSKQDGYLYLFRAPTCDRENYTVEVDARWQGTPGSSYGILFGVTDNFSHYYLFDVNTDYQQFRLYRRSPSGFTQIIAPTYSSAINGGTASNHLKVTRDGNQITLYVNGTTLGTWWDSGITGLSGVGLVSSPYIGSPISDARFDNFSVVNFPTDSMGAKSADKMSATICEPHVLKNHAEPAPIELVW